MNSLEQYLKPPTNNNEEELYNEEGEGEAEGERGEEENDYIKNRENGNDNGENIDFVPYQQDINAQNSKNMNILKNNLQFEDDNNDIVQGINLINKKEANTSQRKEQFENEKNNRSTEKEKNEYDYNYVNHNFLNINENTNPINEPNTQDELINELLIKIHKIKEKRAKSNNKKFDEANKINELNNIDNKINIDLDKTKVKKNKNEFIGKLNISNQVFQNNPKMKELANLLKEYNQEKNQNDKMQITFDNNNQINIVKPEVFFNNYNNSKNINNDYNDQNYQKKYYISAIDGKAIVNGQRIDVNSGFKNSQNNSINNFNLNNNKTFFDFNNEKFMEKRKYYKNWGSNLDFQLNNLNFLNNNENIFKKTDLGNDNKIEFKKIPKYNFLSKDYYNEKLNKINDSLFNMDKNLNKLKK